MLPIIESYVYFLDILKSVWNSWILKTLKIHKLEFSFYKSHCYLDASEFSLYSSEKTA